MKLQIYIKFQEYYNFFVTSRVDFHGVLQENFAIAKES